MIPEYPVLFWQYFDIITLLPITIGVLWILRTHHRTKGGFLKTISHTIASSKQSQLLFSILMTIFFPFYYGFLWFWVGPAANAPNFYYWLVGVSAIAELMFIWLPETGAGIKSKIHKWTALFVGMTMFIMPALLLASSTSAVGTASILGFYISTGLLGFIYLFKNRKDATLILEAVYCIVFILTISVVAHT